MGQKGPLPVFPYVTSTVVGVSPQSSLTFSLAFLWHSQIIELEPRRHFKNWFFWSNPYKKEGRGMLWYLLSWKCKSCQNLITGPHLQASFIIEGYVWQILDKGPFCPLNSWVAPKKLILNRVNTSLLTVNRECHNVLGFQKKYNIICLFVGFRIKRLKCIFYCNVHLIIF